MTNWNLSFERELKLSNHTSSGVLADANFIGNYNLILDI